MTNGKSLFRLSLVLVATLLAHVALYYNGSEKSNILKKTHLLRPDESKAFRIEISRQEESKTTQLVFMRRWRLTSPFATMVDEPIVHKFLDALTNAEILSTLGEREYIRLGYTLDNFGLKDPHLTVTIISNAGKRQISFGSKTPSDNGVYARVEGESSIYVVDKTVLSSIDIPPEKFRRKAVFPIGLEEPRELEIKRGTSSFLRFVNDDGSWKMTEPKKSPANSTYVSSLIKRIMSAQAETFIWPTGNENEETSATTALKATYGLDTDNAISITLKGRENHNISLGKVASGGEVYALIQGGTAIVTVDAQLKELALEEVISFTDSRLFPVKQDSITHISIVDGATTYLMSRDKSRDWRLDSPVVGKAENKEVESLLTLLTSLNRDDPRISASNDDTRVLQITLRPDNGKTIALPREIIAGKFLPENLRSLTVLNLDVANVKRIVLSDYTTPNYTRTTSVIHNLDRSLWQAEKSNESGNLANTKQIETILSTCENLKAEKIVSMKVTTSDLEQYGLINPSYTIAFDTRNDGAVRRNILIGSKAKEGGYYATIGSADAVFILSQETVNKLTAPIVFALQ